MKDKKYKDYVKDTFGYDCKINLVDAYTNKSGFSEKSKVDGISVVGTVNYDVPFNSNCFLLSLEMV